MKKIKRLSLALLAICMPFIALDIFAGEKIQLPYLLDTLFSSAVVIALVGLFAAIVLLISSHRDHGNYFFLYDIDDIEIAEKISKATARIGYKALPPTIDFYLVNTKNKAKEINKYLSNVNFAIILIGDNSADSTDYTAILKNVKKQKLNILPLVTNKDVAIPTNLSVGSVMTIDEFLASHNLIHILQDIND